MTLIQQIEFYVAAAIRDTFGNDLLLGIIGMLLFGIAFAMMGLSLEASLILFIPAVITVLLVAGLGVGPILVLGLIGGIIIYLAFTKLVNR